METPGRDLHFGCGDTRKYLENPSKIASMLNRVVGATLTRFLKGFLNIVEYHHNQNVDLGLECPFPVPIFKNTV